jgi:hypothetical protein
MLKLEKDQKTQSTWCSASREDLCAAVQFLRDNFITYAGPFVIKSEVAAFRVSHYLLTADELVALYKSGCLTQEGLANFAKGRDAAEGRLGQERRKLTEAF